MSRARHAPINFHPAASLPSKTRPEQIQVQPNGGMERRRAGIAPLEAHRHAQAPVTGTFGLQITARARSSPCEDPPQELASSNSCCRPRSSCREAQGDGQQRPGALFLLSCPLSALAGRDLELQVLVHHLRPLQEGHLLWTRQLRPRAVAELPRVPESPGIQSGAELAHGRRCEDEQLRPRRRSLRLVVRAFFRSRMRLVGLVRFLRGVGRRANLWTPTSTIAP